MEILASELRIGNWYDHNGKHCQVSPNTILEVWESPRKWVQPIPLTPEILEKCGFEWEDIETHTDKTTRGLYKSILMMLPATSNCWYAAPFGYPLSLHRTLYLHQLQNLYFALTGEELEVKL
jgi:hypothetical protein